MVDLKILDKIIKKLADKYEMPEEISKKHVNYILNRFREILDEEETFAVKLGDLGNLYLSLPLLNRFKNNDFFKAPSRKRKYKNLVSFLEQDGLKAKTRQKLVRFPRYMMEYYTGGKNYKESQIFQNGED